MPLTLAELVVPRTADQEKTALFDGLTAAEFPVTAWQPGDVGRTLVEVDAAALAQHSSVIAAIAKGGLLDEASGDWLTLLAKQVYNVDRKLAIATKGTLVLTAAPSAGPYTIQAGQLTATTADGKRFQNVAGGTLTAGGTLSLTFQAESPGSAYNVANGAIASLATPLAGVTVANPGTGGVSWISTFGTDDEADASLRQRCRDAVAASGPGATAAAYRTWAQQASQEVTRVQVSADAGTGAVTVLVAGSAGPVSSQAVSDVQAYIADRQPICVQATAVNASPRAVNVTATLYGDPTFQITALAQAQANLQALVKGTPIGGKVRVNAVIEALMEPGGVDDVDVGTFATITLASNEVATIGTFTLTFQAAS